MEKKVIVQRIDNRLSIASQKSFSQNVIGQNTTIINPVISSSSILKPNLAIFKNLRRFPTDYTSSPGDGGKLMISNDDLARPSTSGVNYNPTMLSRPASFIIASTKDYLGSQSPQKVYVRTQNPVNVTDSSKSLKSKSRKIKTIKCASRSDSPKPEHLKAPNISGTSKKLRAVLPKKNVSATDNDQSVKISTSLSNQKSIVVLKRNLMPVSLDSKKSATSSVPDFLENDILDKGLEVLNSLDDSSLDDLVTKVMDVVNKMYGDYLEEELSAYLGAEKYRQIASQELTTFPEFLARQYVKLDQTGSGSINANSQFPKVIREEAKSKSADDIERKTSNTASLVKSQSEYNIKLCDKYMERTCISETDKIHQVTSVEKPGFEEEYFMFNRPPGARLPEKIFESPEMVADPLTKQSIEKDHVPDKSFETPEKRTYKKKPKLLDFGKPDENQYNPLLSRPSKSPLGSECIIIDSSPEGNCATNASHGNEKNFGNLLSPMLKSPESLCMETSTPVKATYLKKSFTSPEFKSPKITRDFPGIPPGPKIESLLLRMRGGTANKSSNKSEEPTKIITKETGDNRIELLKEEITESTTTPDTDLNCTNKKKIRTKLASKNDITEPKTLPSNDPNQYLPKQNSRFRYNSDIDDQMNKFTQIKSTATPDTDLNSIDTKEIKTELSSNNNFTEAKILHSNDSNSHPPKQDSKCYNSDLKHPIKYELVETNIITTPDTDVISIDNNEMITELASHSITLHSNDPSQHLPKQDSTRCNTDIEQSMNELTQIKFTTTRDTTDLNWTDRNEMKTELASISNVILHSNDPNRDTTCCNTDIEQSMNELTQIKCTTTRDTDLNSTAKNEMKTELASNSDITETKLVHSSDPGQYLSKPDSKCHNSNIEKSINEIAQIKFTTTSETDLKSTDMNEMAAELVSNSNVLETKILHSSDPNQYVPKQDSKYYTSDIEQSMNEFTQIKFTNTSDTDLNSTDKVEIKRELASNSDVIGMNILHLNYPNQYAPKQDSKCCYNTDIEQSMNELAQILLSLKDADRTSNCGISNESFESFAQKTVATVNAVPSKISADDTVEKEKQADLEQAASDLAAILMECDDASKESNILNKPDGNVPEIKYTKSSCGTEKILEPKALKDIEPTNLVVAKALVTPTKSAKTISKEAVDENPQKFPAEEPSNNQLDDKKSSEQTSKRIAENAVSESTKVPFATVTRSAKKVRFDPKITDSELSSTPKNLKQKSLIRSSISNEQDTVHIKKPSKQSLKSYDNIAGNTLNKISNSSNKTADATSDFKDTKQKSIKNSSTVKSRDPSELNSGENSSNNTLPPQNLQQNSDNNKSSKSIVREAVLVTSESDEEDCKPLKAIQKHLFYTKGLDIKKTSDLSNVGGSNYWCSEKSIDLKPTTTIMMSKVSLSGINELFQCAPHSDYLVISDSSDGEDKLQKMTGDYKQSCSNVKTEGQVEVSVKKTIVGDRFVGETIGIPMPPKISNSSDLVSNNVPTVTRNITNSVKKGLVRDRIISETISVPNTPTGQEDFESLGRRRKLRMQNLRQSIRINIFHLSKIIRYRIKKMRNTCRIYNALVNLININARDTNVGTDILRRKMKKLHVAFNSIQNSMIFQQRGIKQFKNELKKLHLAQWNNGVVSRALIKQKKKQVGRTSDKLTVPKENQLSIKAENVSVTENWEDFEPNSCFVNEPGLQGAYEEHIFKAPIKTYGRGKKNVKKLSDSGSECIHPICTLFDESEPGSGIIDYNVEVKEEKRNSNSPDTNLPSPKVGPKEDSPQPIEEKTPLKRGEKRKRTNNKTPAKEPSKPQKQSKRKKVYIPVRSYLLRPR